MIRCKVPEKIVVVPIHFFGYKSPISSFGERFRDGQYSLVSFFFIVLLLTVPPCPVICKSGGTCPRVPWSRHGLTRAVFRFHSLELIRPIQSQLHVNQT